MYLKCTMSALLNMMLLTGVVRTDNAFPTRPVSDKFAAPSCEPASQGSQSTRPIVGAIRWDAWHGDKGIPGKAVQASLGPKAYHYRLPFFAVVAGDDDVHIDGTSQEIMDKEIELASQAGLDYWAFVTYPPDNPMSLALNRYLSSSQRNRIKFCLISECGRWRDPGHVERLCKLMAEPGYLTVLGDRPVLYLLDPDQAQKALGSITAFRERVDGLREAVRKTVGRNPYIVVMAFDPKRGKEYVDQLGCDALSSYATEGGGKAAPYSALAAHAEEFWDRCKATGAQVIPVVMSGWDRRPRIARPVPWETYQRPGVGMDQYYEPAKPDELARHLARAVDWLQTNRSQAKAGLAIIYAWNENDEGGWLVPTLGDGNARLEAIGKILKTQNRRSAAAGLTPPAK